MIISLRGYNTLNTFESKTQTKQRVNNSSFHCMRILPFHKRGSFVSIRKKTLNYRTVCYWLMKEERPDIHLQEILAMGPTNRNCRRFFNDTTDYICRNLNKSLECRRIRKGNKLQRISTWKESRMLVTLSKKIKHISTQQGTVVI